MKAKNSFRSFPLILLILIALVFASCATPATESPTTSSESAPAASAPEEAPVAAQEEVTSTVEQSPAAQSAQLQGVTVTSDEEVSSLRTNYGGEYRDVAVSDAVSFHPYLTTDTASSGYQGMVYSGALLRLDENTLEYIPNMAESYTISEDGLTFTFNLRQGMLWSDGTPITAQDFQWTYDQVTNPDNEFPYLSQLSFIESYEALDDYTLQIKIGEIYAPALGQMSGLITPLPKHIWENLAWGDPETNPEINQPTVVSGPYKLVEWQRDQYVIFEANENYWYHGRPNFDRYVIEIVPDQDIAYQKMKSGESDTGDITPENLEEARQLDNVTVYEWWPAAASWSYIGLNMREGFATNDVNVRHGLTYAIDKQLLTDEVMLGQAQRLCSVFPETSWVYNPDVPCYEYDTEKALAEFAEAGYTMQDGQLVDANGDQLTLKLVYGPNTNKVRELMAVVVQDMLSDIGINVEVQALEWASFLDTIQSAEPDWDMFISGWRATIEPHIMYTIWAEESIPTLNSVAYVNKEVEQLFQEGGATYDTEVRQQKYQEAQRIIAEESPYIFLFYNKSWSGQNNRIQGIEPTALGIGWNSEDWHIEQSEQ
ncbi:MAG: ABC transporter substrate-binding protein [Caldilineaceae bacterium]